MNARSRRKVSRTAKQLLEGLGNEDGMERQTEMGGNRGITKFTTGTGMQGVHLTDQAGVLEEEGHPACGKEVI